MFIISLIKSIFFNGAYGKKVIYFLISFGPFPVKFGRKVFSVQDEDGNLAEPKGWVILELKSTVVSWAWWLTL